MQRDLLKGKIKEKGMNQSEVAEKIGMSLSRFNAKLNHKDNAEFTLGEVYAIKDVLGLSTEQTTKIFLT